MADPISFDLIEGHKENIQPIRSGRSARALVAKLTPLAANPNAVRSEHYARQSEFEEELKTATDLDDPLEVWVRYVYWTVETFTSGHSTESGLLPLLERATKEFLHDAQYKSDPRYLKLWVQYAQDFSDAPREVYAYLARNDIGQRLALFYEEYAALLESMGRRNQAAEIYQSGIENGATPTRRLQRKYDEFLKRVEANPIDPSEPSSPALPTVRPALAAKPFGGSAAGAGLGLGGGLGGASEQQQQQPQPASAKPPKMKMAIFSDADKPASDKVLPDRPSGGWDNIGTLAQRKKENTVEPAPWAGQIMKSQTKKPEGDRLMVFRDGGSSSFNTSQPPMSKPTGRNEHIAVNLELVYPEEEEGEEYSPEELRAKSRGWYGIDWNAQREEEQERRQERRLQPIEGSRTPIKIKTVLSPSPNKGKIRRKGRGNASPTMTFHTKAATDEIYSIFNQPLKKADSESGDSEESDFESDGEGDYTTTTQVETTTSLPQDEDGDDADSVHSNWSDFNLKNLPNQGDDENESDTFGDLGVNKATGKIHKLSIFSDEPEQPRPRKLQIPSPPKDFDPPTLPYHLAKDQGQSYLHSKLPFMTPIVERTEQLPGTAARNRAMQAKTPSRVKMPAIQDGEDDAENDDDTFMGGDPFRELSNGFRKSPPQLDLLSKKQPLAKRKEPVPQGPIIDDKVCNPLDEGMRALVFQKLQPPLKSYEGYYEYSSTNSGKAAEIKKYTRIMAKQNSGGVTGSIPEPPLIEFITGQGGSAYTIRRELGKGAFAPVYLVENHIVGDLEEEAEDGEISPTELEKLKAGRSRWEALKMEHPPNPWEFYMIYQAHQRLAGHRTADSIIKAHEMHLFKDEGFLLLSFRDQGTILDLINLSKSDSTSAMDELLAMFLTIELLRTTEALHANSLIHGDLKADNCLVRFDPVPDAEWSTRYHPSGAAGWSRKGISLIDFGRGIDMRLFQPNVQFIADWKTDNQDCAEMRELRPWTYQVDYHGLAAIVHSMLFGKYIETVAERTGLPRHYRIASPLKRYWEREIWSELFDVLLNPLQHVTAEEGGVLPINAALRRCRERMEAHLVAHCDKGVGLKSMVRKMEVAMGRRR